MAKVSSTPRRADDSKLPDGEVRISTTPQTITVGDKPLNFYDDGGKDGKITEQFEGQITFVPKTAGKHVKITFNKLDLFNTNPQRNDQLHIYNGKEAKADKLLRTLLKDKTPIVLRSGSEDGALTVTLKSTTGVTKDGFEAVVEEYTPLDMTLVDILQSQASSGKGVTAGSVKQEILQLNLQTKDNLKPLSATSLTFTSEGSTEGIITRAELWTIGEGTVKPAVKLGETSSVGKTFTITLSSPLTLSEGDNNLILYYDISERATTGGTIDAALTSAVISGKTQTPSKTEVTGNRPIKNEVISAEGHHTYKVFGEWSFASKTAPYSGKYEGGNKDQITTFVPDASGRVIEIDFKSFSVYYGKSSLSPKAKFEVYDGTTASGTPIWKADITNHNEGPKILRSSSADGALTIVFNPNQISSTYTDKGWTAELRSVTPKAMTITQAAGFQASTDVAPVGAAKLAILGLELQTEGFLSPLTLDQLKVKLKGNEGHLSRIALYASHDKKEFNSSYLVAEASAPLTAEVTLVPTANKTLAVGANYYYLAFDLKADAPHRAALARAARRPARAVPGAAGAHRPRRRQPTAGADGPAHARHRRAAAGRQCARAGKPAAPRRRPGRSRARGQPPGPALVAGGRCDVPPVRQPCACGPRAGLHARARQRAIPCAGPHIDSRTGGPCTGLRARAPIRACFSAPARPGIFRRAVRHGFCRARLVCRLRPALCPRAGPRPRARALACHAGNCRGSLAAARRFAKLAG